MLPRGSHNTLSANSFNKFNIEPTLICYHEYIRNNINYLLSRKLKITLPMSRQRAFNTDRQASLVVELPFTSPNDSLLDRSSASRVPLLAASLPLVPRDK